MRSNKGLLEYFVDPISREQLTLSGQHLHLAGQDIEFPIIAGTPILQPDPQSFLRREYADLTRVLAEFQPDMPLDDLLGAILPFSTSAPTPQDAEILGEGFPGFWEQMPLPSFLVPLTSSDATTVIASVLAGRHRGLALDLGCGQGPMTQVMGQMCERVIGIETNLYLAALANRLLRQSELEIPFFDPDNGWQIATIDKTGLENALVACASAYSLPFSEPLFDWIHCGHLLDLLEEPETIIQRILSILKPGAVLSIASPRDFEQHGHFAEMNALLADHFQLVHEQDGIPYLRWNHARRYGVLNDWVWIGKLG
jgi:SAM-dependent methyltransferase